MKNLFSCFVAFALLSSISACSYFNYDGEEPITCYVQISWNERVFRGRDSAQNIKKALNNATIEACEAACRRDLNCEESCHSDAPLVFSSCRDRRTDSIVEETGSPQLPPPLPHFAQNHRHHPNDPNAPHSPHHLPPLPPPPPIADLDPIVCNVQISWQNNTYDGLDDGKSLKRARREAINEACEIACGDDDSCEENCSKNANILSSHCTDLRTREVLEQK